MTREERMGAIVELLVDLDMAEIEQLFEDIKEVCSICLDEYVVN